MKEVTVIDLLDLSFVTGIPTPALFEMVTTSDLLASFLKGMMFLKNVAEILTE